MTVAPWVWLMGCATYQPLSLEDISDLLRPMFGIGYNLVETVCSRRPRMLRFVPFVLHSASLRRPWFQLELRFLFLARSIVERLSSRLLKEVLVHHPPEVPKHEVAGQWDAFSSLPHIDTGWELDREPPSRKTEGRTQTRSLLTHISLFQEPRVRLLTVGRLFKRGSVSSRRYLEMREGPLHWAKPPLLMTIRNAIILTPKTRSCPLSGCIYDT